MHTVLLGALGIVVLFVLAVAGMRLAGQSPRVTGGRSGKAARAVYRGPRRPSLIVTGLKSAGVKVKSDHLPGAVAELAGRATGHVGRRARHHGGRAARAARRHAGRATRAGGQRATGAARRRWDARGDAVRRPLILTRNRPGPDAPDATTPADAPAPAGPAPAGAPAPAAAPNGDQPMSVTTHAPAPRAGAAGLPADHQSVISRIAGFEPEDDTALLRFMSGEVAAACAQADALRELFETCTGSVGLDPSAVHGLGEYADAMSDAAQAMARAHLRFTQVYAEVREAVARGVVLPHNGRFFSGQNA